MPPQIVHRAFVHQVNGLILVSDGSNQASFADVAAFREFEPDYALPNGALGRNYERRGNTLAHELHLVGGAVTFLQGEAAELAELDVYIDKAADYAAALAVRGHILYGVTDLTAAREIVSRVVANLFEAKSEEVFAQRSKNERATFERQLAEAVAWQADNNAATPFLDAILLPNETKGDLVTAILERAATFTVAAGALLQVKRAHLQTVWETLNSVAALKAFMDPGGAMWDGWPAIGTPEPS